ncbi:hypothetical protein JR065_15875 [Xanthomonas sp. AmX2]|uniref:hypothetical protein n=1 Tax=Xanthomonas sp. TaxID=29446 RepID=UPI00198037E7|nr:hypothetical protein [Xanthomonas sp.]MBN6151825.1 hypothetical protein [Xanthomonas sp.]
MLMLPPLLLLMLLLLMLLMLLMLLVLLVLLVLVLRWRAGTRSARRGPALEVRLLHSGFLLANLAFPA